jgi:8-oxo-dGTP diphosphatase
MGSKRQMASSERMPILAASACVIREEKVLLVRRPEDVWAFPGGQVEPGETISEAATRELFEETGVTANLHTLAGQFDITAPARDGRPEQDYTLICLIGDWLAGDGVAQSDALELKWVHVLDLKIATGRMRLAPNIAEVLEMARKLLKL